MIITIHTPTKDYDYTYIDMFDLHQHNNVCHVQHHLRKRGKWCKCSCTYAKPRLTHTSRVALLKSMAIYGHSSFIYFPLACGWIVNASYQHSLQIFSDAVRCSLLRMSGAETVIRPSHRPQSQSKPGNCISYDPVGWEVFSQLLGCHILQTLKLFASSRNIMKYPECVVSIKHSSLPASKSCGSPPMKILLEGFSWRSKQDNTLQYYGLRQGLQNSHSAWIAGAFRAPLSLNLSLSLLQLLFLGPLLHRFSKPSSNLLQTFPEAFYTSSYLDSSLSS